MALHTDARESECEGFVEALGSSQLGGTGLRIMRAFCALLLPVFVQTLKRFERENENSERDFWTIGFIMSVVDSASEHEPKAGEISIRFLKRQAPKFSPKCHPSYHLCSHSLNLLRSCTVTTLILVLFANEQQQLGSLTALIGLTHPPPLSRC